MLEGVTPSELRLRKLQLTTSSVMLSLDEKISAILKMGLESFKLDLGILSKISGNRYLVHRVECKDGGVDPGAEYPLSDTYCNYTLMRGTPTAVHYAKESEWVGHPCYKKFHLEAYIGCAIYVAGHLYGTLNFSSAEKRDEPFTESDLDFLQLMAQWLGLALERHASRQKVRFKNELLSAITHAHEMYIDDAPICELFDDLLENFTHISESEFGFLCEVRYASGRTPYFKSIATNNIAWDDDINRFYENAILRKLHCQVCDGTTDCKGITQDTISEIKVTDDPSSGGFPEKHPKTFNFLAIPMFQNEKLVGVIALGNRRKGFNENFQKRIDSLVSACTNILCANSNREKQRSTEIAFRESEERFHAIFKFAPFGAVLLDLKGMPQEGNIAFKEILGYRDEHIKMMSFLSLSHPEDAEVEKILFNELVRGERDFYKLEKRYFHHMGQVVWTNIGVSLIRDRHGNPQGAIAMMENITKRKNFEKDLTRFKATLDQTLDCVFMFSAQRMKFTYVNRGAMDQVGYSYDELMKMSPVDIKPKMSEKEFKAMILPLINKEIDSLTFETIHQHRLGKQIPVEIFLQYISPEGESPRFVAIVRDISERKKIDRMKNEFISTVSHELRTPLTSIRGSLGLLEGGGLGALPKPVMELVNVAHRNVHRLIYLINDILDMDKIESGELSIELEEKKLHQLIESAIESNLSYADQHRVDVLIDGGIPGVSVNVDPVRFIQIMSNLISNAVKFSKPDSKVLIISEQEGDKVSVFVKDYGRGIPAEFQEKLFAKFTQADSSDRREKGGTGLGLSISKALVEKMGGNIRFKNNPEGGAIFYFTLPVAE